MLTVELPVSAVTTFSVVVRMEVTLIEVVATGFTAIEFVTEGNEAVKLKLPELFAVTEQRVFCVEL